MKNKTRIVLAITLFLLTFFAFASCDTAAPAGSDAKDQQNAAIVSSPTDEISSQTPQQVLEPAFEVYGWFVLETLPTDPNDTAEHNGCSCYSRVTDERFPTYEALESYVKNYFSDDITQKLFLDSSYVGIDGKLYVMEGARGSDILIGDVSYDTKEKSNAKIVYSAHVEYLKEPEGSEVDYTKDYEFVCEKQEGRWVFTKFEYFW